MDVCKPKTVDEYIAAAQPNVREHLERLRFAILQAAAPQVQESISYELPAYKLNGIFVYFGGYTKHVSLFPGPNAIAAFKEELKDYETAGGTIRFPLDKPIPIRLVKKIVRFNIKAN